MSNLSYELGTRLDRIEQLLSYLVNHVQKNNPEVEEDETAQSERTLEKGKR